MTDSGPVNVILYELRVMVGDVPTRMVLRAVEARGIPDYNGVTSGKWSDYTIFIQHMQFPNEAVHFTVIPENESSSGAFDNPIMREVLNVQGQPGNEDRKRLLDTGIFDSDMGDTLFWVVGMP
jgi:hypothetical protein